MMKLSPTRSNQMALRRGVAATCALTAFATMATPAQAQCAPQALAKLIASDAGPNDQFGYSIAISGDTAVVGATVDDNAGGADAGSAYVFVRSGGVWTEQAKLITSDAAINDRFGFSVAVSGDTAVVGAYLDDHAGGADAGSAYVFVRSGTVWTQQARLTASDAAPSDWFGTAVALSGDTAVVGAYLDNHVGGNDSGSTYVFVRSGTNWTQQTKLLASDAAADDNFGYSVAVSGDTTVVGAYHHDHAGGADAGTAYVFVRAGTFWVEQTKLLASDAAPGDSLGVSVVMSGDTAVVGASRDDHAGGANAGSAYVFTRTGTLWTQQVKLIASDAAAGDEFGTSVAISGNMVVVGANRSSQNGVTTAGSAYVFTRAGIVWNQQTMLTASDAAMDDLFGNSVALSGDTAVIAANFDDHAGGIDAGSIYAVVLCCLDTDSDGRSDCTDNCSGVANADQADADNNGVGDACETTNPPGGQPNPACGQQGSTCGMGTAGLMPMAFLMLRWMRPTRRRCGH